MAVETVFFGRQRHNWRRLRCTERRWPAIHTCPVLSSGTATQPMETLLEIQPARRLTSPHGNQRGKTYKNTQFSQRVSLDLSENGRCHSTSASRRFSSTCSNVQWRTDEIHVLRVVSPIRDVNVFTRTWFMSQRYSIDAGSPSWLEVGMEKALVVHC